MRCSECGDTPIAGILRHTTVCSFYRMRPATVLFEHPDLVDLDAELGFWYPDREPA